MNDMKGLELYLRNYMRGDQLSLEEEALFAKISKKDFSHLTKAELWKGIDKMKYYDGVGIFRKKAYGFFNRLIDREYVDLIKTEGQLARLLHKCGIVSSLEEGKDIIPRLINKELVYDPPSYIMIEECVGDKKYRISPHWPNATLDSANYC